MRLLALALASIVACHTPAIACPSDPDPGFGSDGIVTEDSSGQWLASVSVFGKIFVAGRYRSKAAVLKLEDNGELDPSYGDGGRAVFGPFTGGEFRDLAYQPNDGKLLVIGTFFYPLDPRPVIARLEADGEIDRTFGDDGFLVGPDSSTEYRDIAVRPRDGHIAVTGRMDVDGRSVATIWTYDEYGSDGQVVHIGTHAKLDGPSYGQAVVVDDGGTTIAGTLHDTGQVFLARVDRDLELSRFFRGNGIFVVPSPADEPVVEYAVGMVSDHMRTLYVLSEVHTTRRHKVQVRHFTETGYPDKFYGINGKAAIALQRNFNARGLVRSYQDEVTVVGTFGGRAGSFVARFTEDGRRDRTFGTYGVARLTTPDVPHLRSVTLGSGGEILTTGWRRWQDGLHAPLAIRLQGGPWDGEEACVPGCGDGVKTAKEQCDDGNVVNGDGCDAACLDE